MSDLITKQIARTVCGDFIVSTIWIEETNLYETMVFTRRNGDLFGDELDSRRNETLGSALFSHACLLYDYTEGTKK